MEKNCALIVAAGKGTRMGVKTKKQFINMKDRPVLYYTLMAFSECEAIDDIVLVLSPEDIEYCRNEIIQKYNIKKIRKIVQGGRERQESVLNGLRAINDCGIVLIHDGARPFVTDEMIVEGLRYANLYGACACGVKPKDTIKMRNEESFSISTPSRESLFAVQTPQCFRFSIISECHEKLFLEEVVMTDDTMVVERYGYKVYLYEGDYRNIKITTPEDIAIGETILDNKI